MSLEIRSKENWFRILLPPNKKHSYPQSPGYSTSLKVLCSLLRVPGESLHVLIARLAWTEAQLVTLDGRESIPLLMATWEALEISSNYGLTLPGILATFLFLENNRIMHQNLCLLKFLRLMSRRAFLLRICSLTFLFHEREGPSNMPAELTCPLGTSYLQVLCLPAEQPCFVPSSH